jgi:8-oxo-dGTP pyrophosphatase MutT (NUDIX family)
MGSLPGLTTNDEWGYWKGRDPARLVLGVPAGAEHVRYQRHYAAMLNVPVFDTLAETCRAACEGQGEWRRGGACQVPLHIWQTSPFRRWHKAQTLAGNRLESARVEWVFRTGDRAVFFWALHVDVYVAAEGRHKINEVVIARPDVAAVVLYRRGAGGAHGDVMDTEVVLVREFRSNARTPDGFVLQLPGGSSPGSADDLPATARAEVEQEVGLRLDPAAVRQHEARQFDATATMHQAQVFSVELSEDQMARLKAEEAAGVRHGVSAETELTQVRVRTVGRILSRSFADWGTVGMILAVLQERTTL